MTINELRRKLNALPFEADDYQVIIELESSEFGYSPLDDIHTNSIYVPENKKIGEVYDTKWTAEEADFNVEEWEEMKKDKKLQCVLFFPLK